MNRGASWDTIRSSSGGRSKLAKSTYDIELVSYLFTCVRDVFMKTAPVIHSYSKKIQLIFVPERKTRDPCLLLSWSGVWWD